MQISNSIRLSLAGKAVDWTTKTSSPRTFSRISTKISSSAKRRTLAWVIDSSRYWAIACTSGRFELPDSSFIGPLSLLARIHVSLFTPYEKGKGIAAGSDKHGRAGHFHTDRGGHRGRIQRLVPPHADAAADQGG